MVVCSYTYRSVSGAMVSQSDKVTLAISRDLVKKARAKAISEGTTLSAVVTEFIERWLTQSPKRSPKVKRRAK